MDEGVSYAPSHAAQYLEVKSNMERMILAQLQTLREEQRAGFEGIRAEVNARLDKLVTQEAFNAEQRRVDSRFDYLTSDVEDERAARVAALLALDQRSDKLTTNLRWLAAAILLPIALFVSNLLVMKGS